MIGLAFQQASPSLVAAIACCACGIRPTVRVARTLTTQRIRLSASSESAAPGGTSYHVPVLRDESVKWLITDTSGTYVDATLGGGGHSEAILAELAPNGGHLFSIDRDFEAVKAAGERLASYVESGHSTLLHTSFANLPRMLPPEAQPVDGILLDLGVSSHQIDEAERGFSFRYDGPLDMRMDQGELASVEASAESSITAATILNEWSAQEIASVIFHNGEEPMSRHLARAIVAARPLTRTTELKAVVEKAAPGPPKVVTKRLARVFQALRIEVNREMAQLEAVLASAAALVKPGGRIVVLSYHSLEDGRTKRFLRSGRTNGDAPPRDFYGNVLSPWVPLTRQPVSASDAEVAVNPRARSVRLRVGERTEHPDYEDEQ